MQQQPRRIVGAEHAKRRLRLAPPCHEGPGARHLDPAGLLVEEGLVTRVLREPALLRRLRAERRAAARSEPEPRQMPVRALARVAQMRLEQRPPRRRRREARALETREFAVEHLGEGDRIGTVDRAVPAQHRRHHPRQRPREGNAHSLRALRRLAGRGTPAPAASRPRPSPAAGARRSPPRPPASREGALARAPRLEPRSAAPSPRRAPCHGRRGAAPRPPPPRRTGRPGTRRSRSPPPKARGRAARSPRGWPPPPPRSRVPPHRRAATPP